MFPAKSTQECSYYELILGLLRSQKASMGSQDQAQITFRYENAEMGFRDSQEAVC